MMERRSLIGYAVSFVSFLLDSKVGGKIDKIILFGSVARGEFDEDSDIDLFIDTDENIEKEVNKALTLFKMSQAHKTWQIKGVDNEISVKVGEIEKWGLRRNVISSGVILYGKYNEMPEKMKYYLLIKTDVSGFKESKKMRIWRALYGYKQKVGKKTYTGKGLVRKLGGKKIGKAMILIPMEKRKEIINFLNKNKITYTVNEIWSDTL